MSSKSTKSQPAGKPAKPRDDFPLFAHGNGFWAKKVRGEIKYFGSWRDDRDGKRALKQWADQKDDLLAGRKPRSANDPDAVVLGDIVNAFLTAKRVRCKAGKLTSRSLAEYHRSCGLLIDEFGRNRVVTDLRPTDFEALYAKLAQKHGVSTLGREITMIRSVFKYAVESERISKVVRFGPVFKVPDKIERRKAKAKARREHGPKMFQASEIRTMLDSAGVQLKAMILLAINGGLGNSDLAALPQSAIDLENAWLDFARVKSGIERRIPLWPQTIEALRTAIEQRPTPKDPVDSNLVFVTKYGRRWVRYELAESTAANGRVEVKGKPDDAVAKEMTKLLKSLGIKRSGVNFYGLRHTHETVGGGARDQVALNQLMGHVDNSMSAEYREGIEDSRLLAVTDHIRGWLFPVQIGNKPAEESNSAAAVESRPELRIVG